MLTLSDKLILKLLCLLFECSDNSCFVKASLRIAGFRILLVCLSKAFTENLADQRDWMILLLEHVFFQEAKDLVLGVCKILFYCARMHFRCLIF